MIHPAQRYAAAIVTLVVVGWQPVSGDEASDKPHALDPIYAEQTDSFERKLEQLQQAWQRHDYRLARALTHSLRHTVIQAEQEQGPAGMPLMPSSRYLAVSELPEAWRSWARGWRFAKCVSLTETVGQARQREPIDILLSFPADQTNFLTRDVRVVQVVGRELHEVPCQIHSEVRRGEERFADVVWYAQCGPHESLRFLILYGNRWAELPEYPSDLRTSGTGVALSISNAFFQAKLSQQTGQLERLILKREHGLELFAGGEGHGEPPGIDWAHDYVAAGGFQKFRISLWETCPDFEVIRGPLCTIVRRWGFPLSPLHPVYTPSRLNIFVEYRFYAGLPWFHKFGSMQATSQFQADALRDDEWVFSGYSFTDKLWMSRDGKLHVGDVPAESRTDLWGVGFFHRESRDSFMAFYLEHEAQGLPELAHGGEPTLSYRWHGNLWSRYPLPGKTVPAGAEIRQKNAYVAIPFALETGVSELEAWRAQLAHPLVAAADDLPVSQIASAASPISVTTRTAALARPGETESDGVTKSAIWQALEDCKDAQLYTADISVVELGLIYDVRVRNGVATIIMAMPHRGRPLADYFTHGSISVHPTRSVAIRERLLQVAGVHDVVVQQTWEPAWSSNFVTPPGRRKLHLPD